MTLLSTLLPLFRPDVQAAALKNLPPLKTTVMDTVFGLRTTHEMPIVRIQDIVELIQTLPVVGRGAPATPISTPGTSYQYIEPLALNPSDFISAADLNDLKTMTNEGREAWLSRKIDMLRRAVRRSTEGIAATALTGTIAWPLRLDGGGWEEYSVSYGSVLTFTPAKLWSADGAKVADVLKSLMDAKQVLADEGFGGRLAIWAGEDAYYKLMLLVDGHTATAKVRVEQTEEGVNIAGFMVRPMGETYKNPQTGAAVKKVGVKELVMVALDAEHRIIYCAIDDLDANLRPLPFFAKPIEKRNPSGVEVVANSKPLPVVNPRAVLRVNIIS
jgi:hypothetical protein